MTSRAHLSQALLLALAPLAACGRTEDDLSDWKLLTKGGAAGSSGQAAGGGTSKAGSAGTPAGAGGSAGQVAAGSAGAVAAGSAGTAAAGGTGVAGAGGATSIVCINGTQMPFGGETIKSCFEPFEGGCPDIGLGIVQGNPPDFCGITCQFGGPVPAEPGDPGQCCYIVEQVCEGRPLFVGGRLVTARVVRSSRWA